MYYFINDGVPTEGEYRKGDSIVDSTARVYVCVESGNPGKWEELVSNSDKIIIKRILSNGVTLSLVQNQLNKIYTIKGQSEIMNQQFRCEIESFYTEYESDAINKFIDFVIKFEKEAN